MATNLKRIAVTAGTVALAVFLLLPAAVALVVRAADTPASVKVVNVRCPILGKAIDSDKVPVTLTRDYKGMKVGFCCGPCPGKWDKLSDAEKDAKLQAVMPSKEEKSAGNTEVRSGH